MYDTYNSNKLRHIDTYEDLIIEARVASWQKFTYSIIILYIILYYIKVKLN